MCRKKKSSVGKIYKTTDGALRGRSDIKKPRNVAVVKQRKDDGAVAVVKIYSKKGKEAKIGKNYIPGLTLSSDKHSSLTEDSIVGRQVIFGVKTDTGKYESLYPSNYRDTKDNLTRQELRKVKREVHNDKKKHRKKYKSKVKKWKKHFK